MDYYQILNLSQHASEAEIKAAYRTLIKKYHPDKNSSPEAQAFTLKLNEAYEVLSDPARRWTYDQRFQYLFVEQTVHEEDPREVYRREYVKRKREEEREEARRVRKQELLRKHWVFIISRILSFGIFPLAIFLLLDRYLPAARLNEKIVTGWQVTVTGGEIITYLRTPILTIEVPPGIQVNYDYEHDPEIPVVFKRSPFLHKLKTVAINDGYLQPEFPLSTPPYEEQDLMLWPLLATTLILMLHRRFSQLAYVVSCAQVSFVIIALMEILTR
ncbi:J domain-containing protein [Chryseolinea lacunae]|uniref:J domain-containing protein n=1 Tax=Chryseolinea lacunae TaxID=2801331 RepID=A0ABS1KL22_9BACT|nr:J domain-containing protein [Chryseolinea lacunae]MBL0740146.1 J domain-containing protein [Chryseolinea lacunae]